MQASEELNWGHDLVSGTKFMPLLKKIVNEEFWHLPASGGLIIGMVRLNLLFSFCRLHDILTWANTLFYMLIIVCPFK